MDTAGRIKAARAAKGWSQNELTKASGVSEGLISRLESGERNLGTRASQQIAEALGVSREWLLTGEGEPIPVSVTTTLSNRERAAHIAREGGLHQMAIDHVLRWSVPDGEKRSVLWWLQIMQLQHLLVAENPETMTPLIPAPLSEPASGTRRRAR